jgi:thioredoxin reductase (NADPH)
VALGTEHRQLNIRGEKVFLGKRGSYCPTCDGKFFKGKNVAVIGGADSAAKAALYLSDICKKVRVVYRKHEMRCEPVSLKKIKEKKNIEILYHTNPVEIIGEKVVKKLKIRKSIFDENGSVEKTVEEDLDVDGIFIEAGSVPATELLKDIGVEMENGYVITKKDTRTNIEGVFAAGDVSNVAMRQMIVAAGEGAIAAKGVHEFLMGKN